MYIDDALKYISFPCQKSLIDDNYLVYQMTVSDWMIPQFFLLKKKKKDLSNKLSKVAKIMEAKVLNTRIELVTSAVLMLCYNQLLALRDDVTKPTEHGIHPFTRRNDAIFENDKRIPYKISPFIYPCLLDQPWFFRKTTKEERDEKINSISDFE